MTTQQITSAIEINIDGAIEALDRKEPNVEKALLCLEDAAELVNELYEK